MTPALPEPRITQYRRWLAETRGLSFDDHEALWRWSVEDLHGFWRSVWDHFGIESPTPFTTVLEAPVMPGARWFPGAQLNYARQALRHAAAAEAAGVPALVAQDEEGLAQGRAPRELGWGELARQVGVAAAALRRLGVGRGDRVVAWLPNAPEAVVAFLATASLGAIWSVCSPDMGPVAVLDRFRQIQPKVLVAVDGQRWGHVLHDRRAVLAQLLEGLPGLEHVVLVPSLPDSRAAGWAGPARRAHAWAELLAGTERADPEWLPFDHPLWIVYSSGTTGLPKAIVHGHGGVVLEQLKSVLHNDLHPSATTGERFHWFSSTGWIMWNAQVSALLGGTTACLFDGNPGGPVASAGAPDWTTLWRFAAQAGATFFGAGAAFYASCLKAGVEPQRAADLSRLRAVGSTGSPLSEEGYRWIWERLPRPGGRPIFIACISGGTDFAGAFVAGQPELPVHVGEMQCRSLGAAVHAYSEPDAQGLGRPLVGEVGELVCTEPMPSMPLFFWGDEDGSRYRESYFDMYRHPDGRAIWRHGDWLRLVPRPGALGAVIYGRSDATINRHGVRMGTAELYRAVEALPEVLDSLVVDLEMLGRESWMGLFVVLREGLALDDALRTRLREAIKRELSPRHVPSEIVQMPAVPRTLSGKKMELPVKKLLLGADPSRVLNRDAMANADCLEAYLDFAARHRAAHPAAGAPA